MSDATKANDNQSPDRGEIMSKEIIMLTVESKPKRVYLEDYLRAKLKSLQEFGYPDLTFGEVERHARLVLDGGELNVIGMFMEKEITKED